MIEPIKPDDVVQAKKASFPSQVIEAFNEMIVANWNNRSSTVKQCDVANLIASKMGLETTDSIYANHWLDVEDVYQKAGWKVVYDKPAYCETYEATFTFSRSRP
jgi:formate-dependent phosphoribosylglycinamide formyltransferase (GAR transformylase)